MLNAVRWMLILPAAIIAYILAYTIFFHIAGWNLGYVISNPEPIVPLPAGIAGAAAFLMVGASVAPAHRGITALILLIVQVAFVSLYLGFYVSGLFQNRPPFAVGLEFAGNLLGVGAGFYLVFRAFGWQGTGPVSRLWRE